MSRLRTDSLLQSGLYLLVASIPFEYPERTIPLEIPTLMGAVFLLATLLHPRRCYGRIPAPVLWFGAYLMMFWVALVASGGDYAAPAISEFVVVLQGVLVLLAATNLLVDRQVAWRAMVTLAAACAARAALPFIGLGRTSDAVWTGGERVSALGQNANSAAMILAAGLVALIGLTLMRRRKTAVQLGLAGLGATLMGLAVLETGSRGGLAALIGGVMVFALAAHSWQQRLRNGLIAVVAVTLLTLAVLQVPMMKNRLVDSVAHGNLAGREQLYPALWTMFLERPTLGWGPIANTYELALRVGQRDRPSRASHNIVLELLTSTGLAGTIPFLVGVWLAARNAGRLRHGEHGVLPLALLVTVLLANMSGDWLASKLLWVTLAYAFASGLWRRAPRRTPVRPGRRVILATAGGR